MPNYVLNDSWAKQTTKPTVLPNEQLEFWKGIFESLKVNGTRPTVPTGEKEELLHPITVKELKHHLKRTKNSAPGPDGITVKEIKNMSKYLL